MADSLVKKNLGAAPKKGAACVGERKALIEKRKPLNKQFHPIYEHNSPFCVSYRGRQILS